MSHFNHPKEFPSLDQMIRAADQRRDEQQNQRPKLPKPSSNNGGSEAEPTLERVKQPAPEIPR